MNYYNLQIKSIVRIVIFSVQFVPQGQPLLFEIWHNLPSHLKPILAELYTNRVSSTITPAVLPDSPKFSNTAAICRLAWILQQSENQL